MKPLLALLLLVSSSPALAADLYGTVHVLPLEPFTLVGPERVHRRAVLPFANAAPLGIVLKGCPGAPPPEFDEDFTVFWSGQNLYNGTLRVTVGDRRPGRETTLCVKVNYLKILTEEEYK